MLFFKSDESCFLAKRRLLAEWFYRPIHDFNYDHSFNYFREKKIENCVGTDFIVS